MREEKYFITYLNIFLFSFILFLELRFIQAGSSVLWVIASLKDIF